jgi:ubiquinone/menaquinone biosynthesis C-methylase UbiE
MDKLNEITNGLKVNISKKKNFFNKYFKICIGICISLITTLAVYVFCFSSDLGEKFKGRHERSVIKMYEEDDLSGCCLFTGHFINFGFWEGIPINQVISTNQRLESEKNLYRFVLDKLNILKSDDVLEVACGQGVGTVLALTEFRPNLIKGIDVSKSQINRAIKINESFIQNNINKILFQECAAENLLYPNDSFDKIFSIEAIQHFTNLKKFAEESYRVLKPSGKIAIAGFFGTHEESTLIMSKIIPTVRDGIDHITPIDEFRKIIEKIGFKKVKIKSIGNKVWDGFDKWTSQGELKDSWTRNWYKGYIQNNLDYFIIIAEK